MQHAVDADRRHRGALQGRQQHAAQSIAQRYAEATLERLGDDRRHATLVLAALDVELVRLDQFLPIFLYHSVFHSLRVDPGINTSRTGAFAHGPITRRRWETPGDELVS